MRSLAMTSRVLKLSGFLPAATALVAFVILISLTAGAQRITGTLRGEVSDQNGAAVTSASSYSNILPKTSRATALTTAYAGFLIAPPTGGGSEIFTLDFVRRLAGSNAYPNV